MDIETCVGCGTTENVWVFGRCTKCWLSRDQPPPTCDGCRYGYLNQQGHMTPGGCLYDDILKTDSFILPNHEEPPTLSASSQMYLSRSRSPSLSPPSSPCEKIYLCAHRNCQTIVEQPGSECGKCNKTPSWTQISDGDFCGFADCKECSVYPYSCRTCQCDNCGNLFSLKEDDSFDGMCYTCKQDVTLSTCNLCSSIFKVWSSLNKDKDLCVECSITNRQCTLCEVRYQANETDFDNFSTCLKCRMTPPCECGTCIRCENMRRLKAMKLCSCGEESMSELFQQCIDCYHDERYRRYSY